ncbi:fused MFS/spermidine synthase [bacterium]|nr:fused MFS/spermidine synthase [bacterium]
MLFFQAALLGGYAYAHLITTRLRPRRQAALHLALVAAALALLPVLPSAGWKPEGSAADPTWHILLLLTGCVGLPYFVLSATSPLLQAWFRGACPGRSPYRLYALSNAGSLLALLSFPFVAEPSLPLRTLGAAWAWAFGGFAILCAWCAARIWNAGDGATAASAAPDTGDSSPPPSLGRRMLWLALAACGSVMLLAVTNEMCQDVGVVPFLWVLPLSIYLLSFIICFGGERWYVRSFFWPWLIGSTVAMLWVLERGHLASIPQRVVVYSIGLFGCCMVCHGELVRLKPRPRHLTSFYLSVSAGGALGGIFVTLLAPMLFDSYAELHWGLWACCVLGVVALWAEKKPHAFWPETRLKSVGVPIFLVAPFLGLLLDLRSVPLGFASVRVPFGVWGLCATVMALLWMSRKPPACRRRSWLWVFLLPAFGVSLLFLGTRLHEIGVRGRVGVVTATRNFYGVLQVAERNRELPEYRLYLLRHGRITHGTQFQAAAMRRRPTSYYRAGSGIGLAILNHPRRSEAMRVGVLGLGVGTVATYGYKGDLFRFYEINPEIQRLAATRFTYLADSDADCQVVMGDGRLSLAREEDQRFDLLILDAFSGDAVPVHLLTREAAAIYFRHLRDDGILVINISNRYLDLDPVVQGLADHLGTECIVIHTDGDNLISTTSRWALLTRNAAFLADEAVVAAAEDASPGRTVLWTDDYSSLFGILR